MDEVCQISLYLMDNKDKLHKQHCNLERQLAWLKSHHLPTDVIKDQCIQITQEKKAIVDKELRLETLNTDIYTAFRAIEPSLRDKATK